MKDDPRLPVTVKEPRPQVAHGFPSHTWAGLLASPGWTARDRPASQMLTFAMAILSAGTRVKGLEFIVWSLVCEQDP